MLKNYKVIFFIGLFWAFSCSQVDTSDLRGSEGGGNNGDEEFADEDAALPANISGSFLTCARVSQEVVSSKAVTKINCAINNRDEDSDLAFDKKASQAAKDLIAESFELKLLGAPILGNYEVTSMPEGSVTDYKITLETDSVVATSKFLNESIIQLDYNQSLDGNKSLAGQLKTFLPDLLEGTDSTISGTNSDLPNPQVVKKNYTLQGTLKPDFTVDVIASTTLSNATGNTVHPLYSILSTENKNYAFGSVRNYLFSGDGYEQAVGSENSLWVSFGDDLSLQQAIVQYGGDGESAIFAAKMRNDGYIFTAGKKALRGLRGVTEDLHNASLFMIDPQTGESVLGGAEFGQDVSNEVVWGLDFDKDGTVLAVGYTERDGVEGKAGYIGKITITSTNPDQPAADFDHQWLDSPGEQAFNDVSVLNDGNYAVVGVTKQPNCDYTDGFVIILNKELPVPLVTDQYIMLSTGTNVFFNDVVVREDGLMQIAAEVDFSGGTTLNPNINLSGYHRVSLLLNEKYEVLQANLNDGTPVKFEKGSSNKECP